MTIDPTTSTPEAAIAAATTPSKSLGQDAFMQLLVTQLQNQDPTQPQDNAQMITQLAQFSSLEKLTSMDQSLTSIDQLFSAAGAAAGPAAVTGQ
jgi:flagellar basal-body rod modification protein FlgD